MTIMKRTLFNHISFFALLVMGLSACAREDVGPYQGDERTFNQTGFDRLDMGSAFTITVRQGATFRIEAEGDRRNLDDPEVYTRNGTLIARYRNYSRNRKYETSFRITMPTLRGVSFSGASRSEVSGFTSLDELDIDLSGASKGDFAVQADRTNIDLSGASTLQLEGNGASLSTEVSGASKLQAFAYPVETAGVDASGASKIDVSVSNKLVVNASGASTVRYRGAPVVQQKVSGASSVQKE
jgi:hypothetical protein